VPPNVGLSELFSGLVNRTGRWRDYLEPQFAAHRTGRMRNVLAGFLAGRRIAAAFGFGGALATGIVVLLWNQGFIEDYATAFLLDTAEPWKGQIPEPDLLQFETPSGASDLTPRHDDSATAQPQYERRFLQEYFEPSYYAAASPDFIATPESRSRTVRRCPQGSVCR
jgi:hypothetical protein